MYNTKRRMNNMIKINKTCIILIRFAQYEIETTYLNYRDL